MSDNDIPGMLGIAIGVATQQWPHTMDAAVWATKWLETLKDHPSIATDEDSMIGWFANAIMAGYDTANQRHGDEIERLRAEVEALKARVEGFRDALVRITLQSESQWAGQIAMEALR